MGDLIASPRVNFIIVIFIQLIIFVVAQFLARTRLREALFVLCVAAAVGLPIGIFFDIWAGSSLGFFHYLIPPGLIFATLNAVLSYGLAIGTAAAFAGAFFNRWSPVLRHVITVFGLAAALAAILFARSEQLLLSRMFGAGIAIISGIEVGVVWTRRSGPFLTALRGNIRPLLLLWGQSMAVGLCYELANHFFPVWQWALADAENKVAVEFVIVGFGYIILFYPIVFFWQVLFRDRARTL